MKLYKYESYDDYVFNQTAANKRKLNVVWVKKEIVKHAKNFKEKANHIICHGTRNGAELKLFKEAYGCEVIGTEISETATQFPNTVQHDFHEVNEDWIEKFDILYSNSFDHSYDPDKSFKAWKDQIKDDGIIIIELITNGIIKNSDPLSMTENEFENFYKKYNCTCLGTFVTQEKSKGYVLRK